MAKKTETVDETIYVSKLVEAGMEEATAKDKVSKLIEAVEKAMGASESVEAKRSVIDAKIHDAIAALKSEKYKVTIIAVGPLNDDNSFNRNANIKMYNDDPETALMQQAVKIVKEGTKNAVKASNDQWIIALDNRKFLDKAGTKENKFGYGKPIGKRMSRTILGIVDGVLIRIKGDIKVEAGSNYEIFGKASDSNVLYAAKEPVPRFLNKVNDGELYDAIVDAVKDSDIAMDANEVFDTDKKGMLLVKGIVQSALPTNSGKTRIVLSGGLGVFPNDDAVDKIMADAMIGGEVIVAGRYKDSKDPAFARSFVAFHVVGNPKMGAVGTTLDKLKDYEF